MHGPSRLALLSGLLALAASAPAWAARPEPSIASERPDPATVQRYGPAYRYPRAGWIVLHIEGAPYDRGYQHGRLLAAEIADYVKTLATKRSPAAPGDAWRETRTMANALFLRRYDPEYLEEMKGIADGALAAGATFLGRPLDLLDVVTVNSDIEMEFLDSALDATPTGLEGKTFREPADLPATPAPPEHCSAFAATGPATADGKVVIGHITMFSLAFVRHFNVWLDVKPEKGHRVLMQTYPGGIQSGMDYYLNDAGLVVAETTVKQTKFDIDGKALASRIRKALQYAETIDKAVATLKEGNNGMYTNEWLLADTKTDEIAMFELGTHKSKLWRSGKDEWFGGTKGFYWGCNNAKDLDVRLETVPGVDGRPANVVFHPSDRDRTWLKLYEKHKGKIGEAFGFEAFTTPPLAAFPSCDAKFTTSAMAKDLKTWALFGNPLGRTWEPSDAERKKLPDVPPLVSNDWTVLAAEPPSPAEPPRAAAAGAREPEVLKAAYEAHGRSKTSAPARDDRTPRAVDLPGVVKDEKDDADDPATPHPAAWHGTILPKTDADTWLAAAFADYEKIVARELAVKAKAKGRGLRKAEKDALTVAMFAPNAHYGEAIARLRKDVPLAETRSELAGDDWYQIAANKGVLLLAALRGKVGDESFLKLMDRFGRAHAGKPASAETFRAEAEEVSGRDLKPFFDKWLHRTGLPDTTSNRGFWSIDSFQAEPDRAVIVYGTVKESDAQREAAGRLQRQIQRRWSNVTVPILADRDADAAALKGRHVLLVGRPDTNSAAPGLVPTVPVKFGPASFVVGGETYANPQTAVIAAGHNPNDMRLEVVIFAGLSAEATWRCVQAVGDRDVAPAQVLILPAGRRARRVVTEDE